MTDYRSDPIFQSIQWLRDGSGEESFRHAFAAAWCDWCGETPRSVEISLGLTNYKPFERARIVAEVTVSPCDDPMEERNVSLFLHLFSDLPSAEAEYDRGRQRPPLPCDGPPLFLLRDRNLVAWSLPNAPNLHQLADVLSGEGLGSIMPMVATASDPAKLIRYVPMHRALAFWEDSASGHGYYIKVIENGGKAATAALNMREMHAWRVHGAISFAVPRLVRYSPDQHIMVMTELPGGSFSRLMRRLRPEPFEALGQSLAELHGLPAMPMCEWSLDDLILDLRRHMDGVRRALPNLRRRIDTALDRLEARSRSLSPAPTVPIHGNLFGDQVLFDEGAADNPIGIVDWDDYGLGDPHHDLGRFIAHFLYVAETERLPGSEVEDCVRALLDGYEQVAERAIDWQWLEWHVAASLLQRAKISSLRKVRAGWPIHMEYAISALERYLQRERLLAFSDARQNAFQLRAIPA